MRCCRTIFPLRYKIAAERGVKSNMESFEVIKKISSTGNVEITSGKCTFVFDRIRPGLLLVTISGMDKGQFGSTVLDEIRFELVRHSPLELFIDAKNAIGATVDVSQEWTRFFSRNRTQLSRVSILVGSEIVELTVAIAQHLSRTGKLIQIYSDPDIFQEGLARVRNKI
jgi:hypothetical protein